VREMRKHGHARRSERSNGETWEAHRVFRCEAICVEQVHDLQWQRTTQGWGSSVAARAAQDCSVQAGQGEGEDEKDVTCVCTLAPSPAYPGPPRHRPSRMADLLCDALGCDSNPTTEAWHSVGPEKTFAGAALWQHLMGRLSSGRAHGGSASWCQAHAMRCSQSRPARVLAVHSCTITTCPLHCVQSVEHLRDAIVCPGG
jgi:hypothetical protein